MNNLNDIFFAPAANQDLTYEQILEDVQRYFAENHAATIAEAGDGNTDRASSLLKELMVQYIVKRKYAIKGLTTEELCEKLYEDMAGYSLYGLSNAVTRHSQDVKDYDRATALEGIGYNILSMPARQWSRINQMAA